MKSKLSPPRAGVKLLYQGLHQRKCVKRYQESPPMLPQACVAGFFQHEHVKPLDAPDDLSQITGSNAMMNFVEAGFQVVEGEFVLRDETCRQSLQNSAHLVDVNDVGSLKFQHTRAAAVPFGDKALGGENVQRLAN